MCAQADACACVSQRVAVRKKLEESGIGESGGFVACACPSSGSSFFAGRIFLAPTKGRTKRRFEFASSGLLHVGVGVRWPQARAL